RTADHDCARHCAAFKYYVLQDAIRKTQAAKLAVLKPDFRHSRSLQRASGPSLVRNRDGFLPAAQLSPCEALTDHVDRRPKERIWALREVLGPLSYMLGKTIVNQLARLVPAATRHFEYAFLLEALYRRPEVNDAFSNQFSRVLDLLCARGSWLPCILGTLLLQIPQVHGFQGEL